MPKRKGNDADERLKKQNLDMPKDDKTAKKDVSTKTIVTREDYEAMEKHRNVQQQRLEDCREMLRTDPTMSEEDRAIEAEEFKEAQAELRKADRWLKTREIGIPLPENVATKVAKPAKKAKKSTKKTSTKKTKSDKETPIQASDKSEDKTKTNRKFSKKDKEKLTEADGPLSISDKKPKRKRSRQTRDLD